MAQPAAHIAHSVGRRSEALSARSHVRSSIDILIDALFSIEKVRSTNLFRPNDLFRSILHVSGTGTLSTTIRTAANAAGNATGTTTTVNTRGSEPG